MKIIRNYDNENNILDEIVYKDNNVVVTKYYTNNRGCKIKINKISYTLQEYKTFQNKCCKQLTKINNWYNAMN